MYRKNTAGQFISVQLLLTATGAVATGLTPAVRRCIDGTWAAGTGTYTEDGTTGAYKYAMSQADTNGNNIAIVTSATGAMPVCVNFVTTAADPTNAVTFGITDIDATISSRMATFSPLTAAQIATGIWQDTTAGDFTAANSVGKSVMNGVALGTGLTINSYTGNTAQTGDNFVRLGAPAGASVSADVAAVKVDTAAVKVQTDKLTFTVSNQVDANPLSLNGDATAAANIAKTTRAIGRATASGVPTTTSIPTSACTPSGAVADQFKGRIITFDANTTTTALRGQATDITASSNAATPTFTVTALTTAPASGDTFSIT